MTPRIYLYLGALLAIVAAILFYGHTRYNAGSAAVQAKWNAAQAQQAEAVTKAQAVQAAHATSVATHFDAIAANFEAQTHAQSTPLADVVTAGIGAGTLRLRDNATVCPGAGAADAATVRSRAADAAATQALADRTATAIAIVRIGDAADARELQLRSQVIALQDVVEAERR